MAFTEKTETGVNITIARDDDPGMVAIEIAGALKLLGIKAEIDFNEDAGHLRIDRPKCE